MGKMISLTDSRWEQILKIKGVLINYYLKVTDSDYTNTRLRCENSLLRACQSVCRTNHFHLPELVTNWTSDNTARRNRQSIVH